MGIALSVGAGKVPLCWLVLCDKYISPPGLRPALGVPNPRFAKLKRIGFSPTDMRGIPPDGPRVLASLPGGTYVVGGVSSWSLCRSRFGKGLCAK